MDEEVLRHAKLAATRSGCTLTQYIEDALRQRLAAAQQTPRMPAYEVPTFSSGVRPGVDLDSNAALLDVMEAE